MDRQRVTIAQRNPLNPGESIRSPELNENGRVDSSDIENPRISDEGDIANEAYL